MFEFHHRKAVVTGAGSGIGKATATLLTQAGIAVVGLDIKTDPNSEYPIVPVDIRHEDAVGAAVAGIGRQLGGIDLLVNVAGIERNTPLETLDLEAFDQMFAVNVRGTALVTRECLRFMPRDQNDGFRIINTASELAYLGRQGASAYCATKGAILSMTRSWARELAPFGLVNAVAPGPIDTPLINFQAMTPDQQALEQDNPLGRIGQPQEVASVIAFLASSGARNVTGQCYSVDGGAAMH